MRDLLISKWTWLILGILTYLIADNGAVAAAPVIAIAVVYTIVYDVLKAVKELRDGSGT